MSVLFVLIYNAGQDLAGIGARYARAAERLAVDSLRIRSVHVNDTYIRYPLDLHLGANDPTAIRLYREADVVHLNNSLHGYQRFDRGQNKPILFEHHGTKFRKHPGPLLHQARRLGFEQAASTMDLVAIGPNAISWLPAAYNLDELAALRALHRRPDDGKVRIAHAPTDRKIKSTTALIAAVAQLQSEGLPVEVDLIERVAWAQCLPRKAAADIYFDQVILGYGCNAIEAWGMGLPVVAGVDPKRAGKLGQSIPASTRALMLKEFGGSLPFYEADENSIADALRPLVQSADLRVEWAARGRLHAERFHAEAPALERLVALYRRAMARRGRKVAA